MVAGQSPPETRGASQSLATTEAGAYKTTGRSSPATHRAPTNESVWIAKPGLASAKSSRSAKLNEKREDPVLARDPAGLVDVAGKHRLTSKIEAPLPTPGRDLGQENARQPGHQHDPSSPTTAAGSEASQPLVATDDARSATLSRQTGKKLPSFRVRGFKSVTWAEGARNLVASGTTAAGAQKRHCSGAADETIQAADGSTGHSKEHNRPSAASQKAAEGDFVRPSQAEEYDMAKLAMASRPALGAPSSNGDCDSSSDSDTNSEYSDSIHSCSNDEEALAGEEITALLQKSLQRRASAWHNSERVHGGGGRCEFSDDEERNGAGMRERADLATPEKSRYTKTVDEGSDAVAGTAKGTPRQTREHEDLDRALVETAKGSLTTTVQDEHHLAEVVALPSVASVLMSGGHSSSGSGHDDGEGREVGLGTEVATHLLPAAELPARTEHSIQQEDHGLGHETFARERPKGRRGRFTKRVSKLKKKCKKELKKAKKYAACDLGGASSKPSAEGRRRRKQPDPLGRPTREPSVAESHDKNDGLWKAGETSEERVGEVPGGEEDTTEDGEVEEADWQEEGSGKEKTGEEQGGSEGGQGGGEDLLEGIQAPSTTARIS